MDNMQSKTVDDCTAQYLSPEHLQDFLLFKISIKHTKRIIQRKLGIRVDIFIYILVALV